MKRREFITLLKPSFTSIEERPFKKSISRTNAASPRMTGASAEEEIDKPPGKFLRPCRDVAHYQLLAYLSRAN